MKQTNCSVHKIIVTQTFSIEEMEWLLRHAEEYEICESCKYFFSSAIRERIARDCDSLPDRETRPARTNLPGKDK
jgi:hypothetical protein